MQHFMALLIKAQASTLQMLPSSTALSLIVIICVALSENAFTLTGCDIWDGSLQMVLGIIKNGFFRDHSCLFFFLILAFQFAVMAMWFGEKKTTTLYETTEESWSFVMGKWCKSFISKEARWSERECKILRGLRRDAKGCHWLAVTFSLMAMTFCWSRRARVCSCRWLWDSVKLSHSKVKKNKDKHFSWLCLTVTGHSTNTTLLCLLLFKPGNQ